MAKIADYTIHGSLHHDLFAAHNHYKSLPIRRDSKRIPSDLRELYRTSADVYDTSILEELKNLPNGAPAVPTLPPTPPTGNGDPTDEMAPDAASEAVAFFSTPVTPINQNSPPTPDNTPPAELKRPVPRPFLGTQPSLASTQAESFRTAREEMLSDDESINANGPETETPRATRLPARNLNSIYPPPENRVLTTSRGPSRLRLATPLPEDPVEPDASHDQIPRTSSPAPLPLADEPQTVVRPKRAYSPSPSRELAEQSHATEPPTKKPDTLRRGLSLRDRLEAVDRNSPSTSTEKFANIIGWSSTVSNDNIDKRASGASTTSTIGAMVFESVPLPKKRMSTIRKVAKHDSLRSVSEPLPKSRATGSLDSPHRLLHKKAKLCNQNRWSYGSEATRSQSISSSAAAPAPEIIKVAVIPERGSSLKSSAPSSKPHSLSGSSGKDVRRQQAHGKPPSSWQRKRTLSESHSDRGRDQQSKLIVPPRSSSLSAPTSRTTSRANSVTSDHFRKQRKEAETDLRRTLDRMESDRLSSSLRRQYQDLQPDETPSKPPRPSADSQNQRLLPVTPGTSEWAALRPQSLLETPFSQPSFMSASPEIRDATAVNFFPHNNHSLQLIEPNITPESRAVKEVRKHEYLKDDASSTRSPLRHPRVAPDPPAFNVVPPTPVRDSGIDFQAAELSKRPSQRRDESFMSSLTRGFSLRDARNRKKGQQNASLSPFWKPQGFWEAFEDPHPKPGEERDMQVHNSLGMPQERTVITGPVSLVRRISQRRRDNQARALTRQGSANSLSKIRASHKLYRSSIMGMHLPFPGFTNMRERMMYARQRKEEERRERIRQGIRERIGKEVVLRGDSRFLKSPGGVRRLKVRT